jgi:acetyltransferase-like isoleucine patch superfamily enzyme
MRADPEQGPDRGARRQDRLRSIPSGEVNSLWVWRKEISLPRVARNFLVIYLCRYLPFLTWKNALYRGLGVRMGRHSAAGLSATLDVFFPELISIGDNTILGYHSIIMTHEFLRTELRTGPVVIGRDVVIGANCTILPGVVIGDGATVSAHSLVNRDVAPGLVVGGVPARPLV